MCERSTALFLGKRSDAATIKAAGPEGSGRLSVLSLGSTARRATKHTHGFRLFKNPYLIAAAVLCILHRESPICIRIVDSVGEPARIAPFCACSLGCREFSSRAEACSLY